MDIKKGRRLAAPPFFFPEREARLFSSSFFFGFAFHGSFCFDSSFFSAGFGVCSHFFSTGFGVSHCVFGAFSHCVHVGFGVSHGAVGGCFCSVLRAFRTSGEAESCGSSGDECNLTHINFLTLSSG